MRQMRMDCYGFLPIFRVKIVRFSKIVLQIKKTNKKTHGDSTIDRFATEVGRRSKLGFYVLFNSQGHIGTGPHHCQKWG